MKLSTFHLHMMDIMRQQSCTLKEAGKMLKALGIDELSIEADYLRKDPAEARKDIEKLGLKFTDAFGSVPMIREFKAEVADNLIRRCEILGVDRILVTTDAFLTEAEALKEGYTLDEARLEADKRTASGLQYCVDQARKVGIQIIVEDYDSLDCPMTYAEDLHYLLTHVDGLGFGYDSGNFMHAEQDELDSFELLKDYISVVHLKDRSLVRVEKTPDPAMKELYQHEFDIHTTMLGTKLYTCPVGSGIIRMGEIAKRLKSIGFDGTLILEHFGSTEQLNCLTKSVEWTKKTFLFV